MVARRIQQGIFGQHKSVPAGHISAEESGVERDGAEQELGAPLHSRRWLNTTEVARYLSLSVRAIQRLTSSQRIPFLKVGHRTILFDRLAVDEWLEAQVAVTAADAISRLNTDPRRGELILDALARRQARRGR